MFGRQHCCTVSNLGQIFVKSVNSYHGCYTVTEEELYCRKHLGCRGTDFLGRIVVHLALGCYVLFLTPLPSVEATPLLVPNLSEFLTPWEGSVFFLLLQLTFFFSLRPTSLERYLIGKCPQPHWKAQPTNSS